MKKNYRLPVAHFGAFPYKLQESCVGKVVEIMINERLHWILEPQDVLPQQMAWFRERRCTMNCLLDLITSAQHERCRGNVIVAVFLDICGAFGIDTVTHAHVLHGLLDPGIQGRMLP